MARNADYDAPVLGETTRLVDLMHRHSEWLISVYCPDCIRTSRLEPAALVKRLGAKATIADLKRRLRCRECGRSWDLLIKPALRSRRRLNSG